MTDEQWEERRQNYKHSFRRCCKVQCALLLPIVLMIAGIFSGNLLCMNLSVFILFLVEGTFILMLFNMGLVTRMMSLECAYLYINASLAFVRQFVPARIQTALAICQAVMTIAAGLFVLKKIKELERCMYDPDTSLDSRKKSERE